MPLKYREDRVTADVAAASHAAQIACAVAVILLFEWAVMRGVFRGMRRRDLLALGMALGSSYVASAAGQRAYRK